MTNTKYSNYSYEIDGERAVREAQKLVKKKPFDVVEMNIKERKKIQISICEFVTSNCVIKFSFSHENCSHQIHTSHHILNKQFIITFFSAFSLESNALKGPLWLAGWLPQKLGGGST